MEQRYLATVRSRGYEASFADATPPTLNDIIFMAERAMDSWDKPLEQVACDALLADIRKAPEGVRDKRILGNLYVGKETVVVVKWFYDWER
jgi:hypothetical protein